MADIDGYREWLATVQHQPAFINNNWCAMLAHDMEVNSDDFKIPYSIVEEELMKEEHNVNLKFGWHFSIALRHWLASLLKPFNANASVFNYEEDLREFLGRANILPLGIFNPLTPETSFHCLPTECKLWIFYALRNHTKPSSNPSPIAKDSFGNAYYILPSCRLYVRIDRAEKIALPIDEARINSEAWGSLYRHVHSKPCKLLCEDKDGWELVWNAFQLYRLFNLQYTIRPEIEAKFSQRNLNEVTRDKQRKEFEEKLHKLAPVPRARTSKQGMSSTDCETTDASTLISSVENDIGDLTMKDQEPQSTPIEAKEQVKPVKISTQQEIVGKCWTFPQCPLKNKCRYVHPTIPCTEFPNCPRGFECLFLHETCPNDAQCEEPNCTFEHREGIPTYHRIPRGESQRPVASIVPVRRGNVSHPEMKKKRCQFFPQCKNGDHCRYFHPVHDCKKLADGSKCNVQKCLFKHGPCPNDGACKNFRCTYEHYKSPPVIERILAAKKNKGALNRANSTNDLSDIPEQEETKESLSRASSIGNLSRCSVRWSGRKKSVTFDFDSDGESVKSTRKESTEQRPVGILRPSGINSLGRCKFGTRCSNEICEFTHPREKCPAFPKCPNGGACIFLHDVCKNDGVCSKENCDFEDLLPHNIDNNWCKNGSRCKKVGCKFLHPQECIGRCPTPNGCWKYHRLAHQPLPTPRQLVPSLVSSEYDPRFGQGFGFQGEHYNVPPFGPPPDAGYGYGGYMPPFAPGSGYAPSMGHSGGPATSGLWFQCRSGHGSRKIRAEPWTPTWSCIR
ncbi:hypothetical protein PMAYCL1PPCAC_26732 [Pristionchus mayeri]|uniref:Zinc finger CCCH domain-containing protein 14 n=1 Tax=Pristionchus mayeri TaxID=1317129 RepID=A0AAN5D5S3_9BILA|nr:hypothetical protein PMAYCL1PPCAC_26732 [Pristionchus mayeri]